MPSLSVAYCRGVQARATRRLLLPFVVGMLVVLVLANGVSGTLLFARAKADPVTYVDAIIVLGGDHDGREAYGLELAEQGYAPTVVLSNPYATRDTVMKQACRPRRDIKVICKAPDPSTTRGEAIMAREYADAYGWRSIIVISWRYHLPRARRIFEQCFVDFTRSVVMRDVPRSTASRWPSGSTPTSINTSDGSKPNSRGPVTSAS